MNEQVFGMRRFPSAYAPFLFGVIQSAITTGIASGVATYQAGGPVSQLLLRWAGSWGVSWLIMLPVVICLAPLIRRLVAAMTTPA